MRWRFSKDEYGRYQTGCNLFVFNIGAKACSEFVYVGIARDTSKEASEDLISNGIVCSTESLSCTEMEKIYRVRQITKVHLVGEKNEIAVLVNSEAKVIDFFHNGRHVTKIRKIVCPYRAAVAFKKEIFGTDTHVVMNRQSFELDAGAYMKRDKAHLTVALERQVAKLGTVYLHIIFVYLTCNDDSDACGKTTRCV